MSRGFAPRAYYLDPAVKPRDDKEALFPPSAYAKASADAVAGMTERRTGMTNHPGASRHPSIEGNFKLPLGGEAAKEIYSSPFPSSRE
jgi:hypothetical protein